ncbi:LpqB family beta-propeller domain-containing protein [Stackebrandtia nassauensis]|uniref:GerMN domain-containing protein n=1 Tax=Stackebrandtia nassauensis (strain DSM 44728 / CIP 108903 / NRRL B-16338 / NBRC 102104 / LLR-40K-21) TaxID=446470 RepID=D3PYI0_STANL|nr:LpqB family beta-propeller domain-containing protein [Stackebrandtia nassauensis]ADD41547.1 hypothetical protein Snas_1851 [Stackebrandtia nassauensis DSM 44728]
MNRRRDPLLLAVIALLGLSGCGVPSSGPSTQVDKVEQDSGNGDSSDVETLEPSTKEITTVRNFLGAAAGDVNGRDKRLGRFLKTDGKQKWSEPSEGIQLVRIPSDGVKRASDGDSYSAKVTAKGTIVGVYGQNGQVKPWSGDDEFKQTFELERERSTDVWHLTEAPRQVYLSDDFFAKGYRMSPLYFSAASSHDDTLVPDARWLPKELMDSEARYPQLTDWLLGGPSDWISSTVTSAFPEGTSREKAVTVSKSGERVTVDISVDSASQPAKDRETMSAQLAWTMGLSSDQTLSLYVDGQERLTREVSAWSDREHTPEERDSAEGLAYFISDGEVAANEPDAEYVGTKASGLSEAVINREGNRIAVVAGKSGRQRLLVGPAGDLEKVEKFSSPHLEDPQWLDDDTLLVLDNGAPVTVNINSGKRQELSIDEEQGEVSELALSPDARRVAYVAEGRAWLSTVLPDEDSKPKLGDPVAVTEAVTDVGDLAWSRETHLLLIGAVSGEDAWLWEASIDGAYLQPRAGTTGDTARADALAVRCKPATDRGTSDLAGDPVLLQINGIIHRLYTDVSPVQVGKEDAAGMAPFTAP